MVRFLKDDTYNTGEKEERNGDTLSNLFSCQYLSKIIRAEHLQYVQLVSMRPLSVTFSNQVEYV